MSNSSPNRLLYDFYDERLWLTRFMPIDDAIHTVDEHLANTISSLEGVSFAGIEQFIQRKTQAGEELLDELERLVLRKIHALDILDSMPLDLVNQFFEQQEEAGKTFSARFKRSTHKRLQALAQKIAEDESAEDAHDRDFELTQLFNLRTMSQQLRQFVKETLFPMVEATLSEHKPVPPTWLIRACFQQVATDIGIIERAITQRSWQFTPDGKKRMGPQAQALLIADKLAMMALNPAQAMLPLPEHILPITYFAQQTHIHRTPYRDDLLLIGLSYDHISLKINEDTEHGNYRELANRYKNEALPTFELMVIPHEVGHYVYQHGRLPHGESIAQICAQLFAEHPFFAWREEIFADLYSCMVAGPLAVLGLQALIASSRNDTICANDGVHPDGKIRPFILSAILHQLHEQFPDKYPFPEVAHQLAENWQINLHTQGIDLEVEQPAMEPIQQLIALLAETVQLSSDTHSLYQLPWCNTPHDALQAYDEEMANFIQHVFAAKEFPHHRLITLNGQVAQANLPANLFWLLWGWGDDGPIGIGDHTLSSVQVEDLYSGDERKLQTLATQLGVTRDNLKAFTASVPKTEAQNAMRTGQTISMNRNGQITGR